MKCDHTWYQVSVTNIVPKRGGTTMDEEYLCTTCGTVHYEPVYLPGIWPEGWKR